MIIIKNPLKKLIDFFLPAHCLLCGSHGDNDMSLCQACHNDLPWLTTSCFQCARPLPVGVSHCGACLSTPPFYYRTLALFAYDDVVAAGINLFKFHKQLVWGKLFASLLARAIVLRYQDDVLPQCIIPMPLHMQRLRQRGYNQALELANPLAKQWKLPLDKHSCQRVKPTLPQSQTISAIERQANMRNAFSAKKLAYSHVAIVDDVVTTGATVNALTQALLEEAGVQRVDIWCCARTLSNASST